MLSWGNLMMLVPFIRCQCDADKNFTLNLRKIIWARGLSNCLISTYYVILPGVRSIVIAKVFFCSK